MVKNHSASQTSICRNRQAYERSTTRHLQNELPQADPRFSVRSSSNSNVERSLRCAPPRPGHPSAPTLRRVAQRWQIAAARRRCEPDHSKPIEVTYSFSVAGEGPALHSANSDSETGHYSNQRTARSINRFPIRRLFVVWSANSSKTCRLSPIKM